MLDNFGDLLFKLDQPRSYSANLAGVAQGYNSGSWFKYLISSTTSKVLAVGISAVTVAVSAICLHTIVIPAMIFATELLCITYNLLKEIYNEAQSRIKQDTKLSLERYKDDLEILKSKDIGEFKEFFEGTELATSETAQYQDDTKASYIDYTAEFVLTIMPIYFTRVINDLLRMSPGESITYIAKMLYYRETIFEEIKDFVDEKIELNNEISKLKNELHLEANVSNHQIKLASLRLNYKLEAVAFIEKFVEYKKEVQNPTSDKVNKLNSEEINDIITFKNHLRYKKISSDNCSNLELAKEAYEFLVHKPKEKSKLAKLEKENSFESKVKFYANVTKDIVLGVRKPKALSGKEAEKVTISIKEPNTHI